MLDGKVSKYIKPPRYSPVIDPYPKCCRVHSLFFHCENPKSLAKKTEHPAGSPREAAAVPTLSPESGDASGSAPPPSDPSSAWGSQVTIGVKTKMV